MILSDQKSNNDVFPEKDVYCTWLFQGNCVVYPTETVYGLGADIYNENAVRNIFMIKQRPFTQPLSVAVTCLDEISEFVHITELAKTLASSFLPGPLTLILKKKTNRLSIVAGNSSTIGIRIPDHPIAKQLLSEFGPLTSTSANLHQMPIPSTITEIAQQLSKHSKLIQYIDAGPCSGLPSTIVDCSQEPVKILREGLISKQHIWDAIY